MANMKIMPNPNFQCQTYFKNAKFVKSGIEKCQLTAMQEKADNFFFCEREIVCQKAVPNI